MAGIVSYGSYVPYRRLKRASIAQVLGHSGRQGRARGGQLRRGQRVDGGRGAARRAARRAVASSAGGLLRNHHAALWRKAQRRASRRSRSASGRNSRGGPDRIGPCGTFGTAPGRRRGRGRRLATRRSRWPTADWRARGQGRTEHRRWRRGVHPRTRKRDRRDRSGRVADPRVPGYVARSGRAFRAQLGRAFRAHPGLLAHARQSHPERAGQGEPRARGPDQDRSRRAESARDRRSRARDSGSTRRNSPTRSLPRSEIPAPRTPA